MVVIRERCNIVIGETKGKEEERVAGYTRIRGSNQRGWLETSENIRD